MKEINGLNTWCRWFAAMGVLLLAGCAGNRTGDGSDFVQLELQATQENTGAIGQVALVEQGDETGMSFFVGGVPLWISRPVNLLTYVYPGSCAVLGDKPAYSLNNTTQTLQVDGGWRLSKTAPVSLEELRKGHFAVVVRTTPADHSINIFCADTKQ